MTGHFSLLAVAGSLLARTSMSLLELRPRLADFREGLPGELVSCSQCCVVVASCPYHVLVP